MTPDDTPGRRPQVWGQPVQSTPVRRTDRPGATPPGQTFHTWGHAFEASIRWPAVVPVDPAASGHCLCGDPADFVVEMNWFSGRHSQDPVCGGHVDEVVRAIKKEQARRNGG